MNIREINNYFGDMDLFLMDWILKGKIPENVRVLDAGCGEGRNAIFFIQNGYDYLGIDRDDSKIRLAQYMSNNISTSKAQFQVQDIMSVASEITYDLLVCSRVLHFCDSEEDFYKKWERLLELLDSGGMIYVSMDSAIDNDLGKALNSGQYEFPDGQRRFAITQEIYETIKKGLEEIEPLKTLVQNNVRAQSFFLLKKL